MEVIIEAIPPFYGRKDGREDPLEYLESINFSVEEKYSGDKAESVKRIVFRARLRDQALHVLPRLIGS